MSGTRWRDRDDDDRYPQEVVAVLAAHFDLDVFDRQVIVRLLEAHRARPRRDLDIVVDSPAEAHWHLRPHPIDISRVVLDECPSAGPVSPPDVDPRGESANAELARLN